MCSGGTHKRVVRDGEIGNRSAVEAADYFDELPADRVRGRGPEEGIRHGDEVGTCFCGHTRRREVQAEEPARSVGARRWHAGEERPRARAVSSGSATACHSDDRQHPGGGSHLVVSSRVARRRRCVSKLYLLAARSPSQTQHAESPQEPLRAQVESARSRRKRSRGGQGGGARWWRGGGRRCGSL